MISAAAAALHYRYCQALAAEATATAEYASGTLLAAAVLRDHPTAHRLVLTVSDQGEWLQPDQVESEDGTVMYDGWMADDIHEAASTIYWPGTLTSVLPTRQTPEMVPAFLLDVHDSRWQRTSRHATTQ